MIKNTEILSMAQATEYIDKENNSDILGFIKKFKKLNLKEANELKEKIKSLDLMKVNDMHIVKIIDLMPENEEELNKIFTDVSLNEDETNKILGTIKEFK